MSEHDRGTFSSMSDGLDLMDANTEMPHVTRVLATSAKSGRRSVLWMSKAWSLVCVP